MTPHPLKMSDVNVGMRLRDPDDRRFKQEGVLTVTALTEIGFSYDAERDTFIGARHGVLLAKNRQHFGSDGMCRFILLSKPQLAAMTLAPVTHYRIEIGNGTIYASRDPLGPYCLAADVDAMLAASREQPSEPPSVPPQLTDERLFEMADEIIGEVWLLSDVQDIAKMVIEFGQKVRAEAVASQARAATDWMPLPAPPREKP